MKSPLFLWREVAQELGDWCRVSTVRDFKTVADRTKAEGDSFLTSLYLTSVGTSMRPLTLVRFSPSTLPVSGVVLVSLYF